MDAAATLARRALSRPSTARLMVDGEDPDGPVATGVELVDRHGVPLLLCDPDSALHLAALAGRTAILTVVGVVGAQPDESPTVMLRGRLDATGFDRVEERDVALVELVLVSVLVSPADRTAEPIGVGIEEYLETAGPSLVEHAAMVREHLNTGHAAELVSYAARLSGTEPDDIAGAELADLDAAGLQLRWVDLDGSYEVRVLFPRRALCSQQLSELLAATLGTCC